MSLLINPGVGKHYCHWRKKPGESECYYHWKYSQERQILMSLHIQQGYVEYFYQRKYSQEKVKHIFTENTARREWIWLSLKIQPGEGIYHYYWKYSQERVNITITKNTARRRPWKYYPSPWKYSHKRVTLTITENTASRGQTLLSLHIQQWDDECHNHRIYSQSKVKKNITENIARREWM